MTASGQLGRDRRRHRRFADAAFAHEHDETLAGPLDLIDERAEVRKFLVLVRVRRRRLIGSALGKPPQRRDPDQILGAERKCLARESCNLGIHGNKRDAISLRQGCGERVTGCLVWHQPVDGELLVANSDCGQLPRRPGRFGQRRGARPRDKDEPCGFAV